MATYIKDDFSNLPQLIDKLNDELDDWKNKLQLKGKSLELANAEQPAWYAHYDQLKVEWASILKFAEMKVKQERGRIYRLLTNSSSIDLSDKAKDRLIDADPSFLKIYQFYIEIDFIYNKLCSICSQFEQRSYTLTNIVKIRTHNLENAHIITE